MRPPAQINCQPLCALFASIVVNWPAFTSTQIVHVREDGSDTTGDGGALKPFATIAHALSQITDATTSKRYIVSVGAGLFAETSLALKPYVWIVGSGISQGGPSRVTVTGNFVTLSAAFASGSNRAGISNLYFTGSTGLNLDLVALSSSGSNVIELLNIGCNGPINWKANNGADFLDLVIARFFAASTLSGGNILLQQLYSAAALTLDTAGPVGTSAEIVACIIGANLTIAATGGKTNTTLLKSSRVNGALTVDGCALDVDAASRPKTSTLLNGGSLANSGNAYALDYTATTGADWPVAPVNVQDALDKLAARVAALEP